MEKRTFSDSRDNIEIHNYLNIMMGIMEKNPKVTAIWSGNENVIATSFCWKLQLLQNWVISISSCMLKKTTQDDNLSV